MCDACVPRGGWTRRRLLTSASVAGAGLLLPVRPARASQGVDVLPRPAWAGDAAPAGPVTDEPDVRFLLVHHTVNTNDYRRDDVVPLLRDIHRFHTSAEKGWPDIAYNFIVDRFGRAWETRAGSLDRPVAGDATGGNQGFDQKCAFLGDHRDVPPTPEAVSTMVGLLAFLADRSGIDTLPGASTAFVSRGSNLHPAGTEVRTPTINGHRSMSQTACPGDAAFALVRDRFPSEVTARRGATSPTTAAAPPTTASPSTETAVPPSTDPGEAVASSSTAASAPAPDQAAPPATDDEFLPLPVIGAAGGVAAVVLGAALVLRTRRHR